ECRQLAFAALPGLPIGLHDGACGAGVETPGQGFTLLFRPGVSPTFGIGRRAMPLRFDPMHRASLRTDREMEHAKARILAPQSTKEPGQPRQVAKSTCKRPPARPSQEGVLILSRARESRSPQTDSSANGYSLAWLLETVGD